MREPQLITELIDRYMERLVEKRFKTHPKAPITRLERSKTKKGIKYRVKKKIIRKRK